MSTIYSIFIFAVWCLVRCLWKYIVHVTRTILGDFLKRTTDLIKFVLQLKVRNVTRIIVRLKTLLSCYLQKTVLVGNSNSSGTRINLKCVSKDLQECQNWTNLDTIHGFSKNNGEKICPSHKVSWPGQLTFLFVYWHPAMFLFSYSLLRNKKIHSMYFCRIAGKLKKKFWGVLNVFL